MRNARVIRRALRLSLERVARDVNMPFSNIAGFERGVKEISAKRVRKLAEYYGVTMEELLADAPPAATAVAAGDGGSGDA